jgi:hypothetical protein
MTLEDAQRHVDDFKNEISFLLFHKQTLIRKIELLKPKIESKIVKPMQTGNLSKLTAKDLEVDLVAPSLATMEIITAREAFFNATMDLADVKVTIAAKEEMLKTYADHVRQELNKNNNPCSDQMIFEAFRKAQAIKDVTDVEKEAISAISKNLLTVINASKDKRIEVYETLKNIIAQHS